jgi:hypothetical protein
VGWDELLYAGSAPYYVRGRLSRFSERARAVALEIWSR